jgi:hypothetical protein
MLREKKLLQLRITAKEENKMGDKFLTKEIADALCTVITLGFAEKMWKPNAPMVFEYDDDADKTSYELIQKVFRHFGVTITVKLSKSQESMPYILGHKLPEPSLRTFIKGLDIYRREIDSMFDKANRQKEPPRGAYIGVQFLVDKEGNILREIDGFKTDPLVYGPSALSLHSPLFREITFLDEQEIADSYRKAKKSTNDAAVAVSNGLLQVIGGNYDTNYIKGHLFGSSHGMIRAMVNSVEPPKDIQDIQSVFGEIALGAETTKVSSCIPCAIFMQSFGYPASSIHLGRGDNWRLPEDINEKSLPAARQERNNLVRQRWRFDIINYYEEGIRCSKSLFEKK